MTQHSKLPPSSAARRMACPGSRAMCEKYGRDEKSEAASEGDLAHRVAAFYLLNPGVTDIEYGIITDEMREGAKLYVDTVRRFLGLNSVHIEERIDISNIHPDCWGTPDAWGMVNDDLHIFDYKYGFTPVEAFENWQLLMYACGINSKTINIYLHIVQPRDYVSPSKHKMWHLTAEELEKYREQLIVNSALSMSPNASLRVSEQCKYCPARHACPALKQAAFGATELAFRDTPQGLSPKDVGSELKFLHEARDLLEYRITALETEVEHFLHQGIPVDHYELNVKYGNLGWNVDKKEVLSLGQVLGFDLRKVDVLTPTQAIKAGMSEDVVLKYSERKSSLKLNKIDLKKSREVFGK